MTAIFEDQDIGSLRNRLERTLFDSRHDAAPRKSRQECLDRVQHSLKKSNNLEWVRYALDLTTHTLFCADRMNASQQLVSNAVTKPIRMIDFTHWDQLSTFLATEYGSITEELKLLLITGAFAEIESIISREIDGLIGPYRATRDIEAKIRHNIALKPRGFDIHSLIKLAQQYNNTLGTPIQDLVEFGLSKVINLHSNDDVNGEYQRIFVDRHHQSYRAKEEIPLFAISYKHESRDLRMTRESFLEICNVLKSHGFEKVQLWIDAVLRKSDDTWARRGLLPYTVLPIVIHNNEIYNKGKERIWLKLERIASSGRWGVLFTRPTNHGTVTWKNYVNGDSRDIVAACILDEDYDPRSVTFDEDVNDLKAWATEHLSAASFRSYLGISKMGSGRVSWEVTRECLYSGILKYKETMTDGEVESSAEDIVSVYKNRTDSSYPHAVSREFARNERLMTYMCRLDGCLYRVRVSYGLGISVLRMDVMRRNKSINHVVAVHKTCENERQRVLNALTHALIHLAENLQNCHMQRTSKIAQRFHRGSVQWMRRKRSEHSTLEENDTVVLDEWKHWPAIFPQPNNCSTN